MPRAILYLSSPPGKGTAGRGGLPDRDRLQRILDVDGVVSARSFAPRGSGGPAMAVYEIDTDDVQALQARLARAGARAGTGADAASGAPGGGPAVDAPHGLGEMTLYTL